MIIYEFIQKGREKEVFLQQNIDHFNAFSLFKNNSQQIIEEYENSFIIGSLMGILTNENLTLTFTINYDTNNIDDNGQIFSSLRKYCKINRRQLHEYAQYSIYSISKVSLDKFEQGSRTSNKSIASLYISLISYYINKINKNNIVSKSDISLKKEEKNFDSFVKSSIKEELEQIILEDDIELLYCLCGFLRETKNCYKLTKICQNEETKNILLSTLKNCEKNLFNDVFEEIKKIS